MDTRETASRLHDILRDAYRVRLPGLGCTAEASIASVDVVKAGLRALLADLGEPEAPRLPPRRQACVAAMPEGRIAGTRIAVQHRRRTRAATGPAETIRPLGHRAEAEALFRRPSAGSGVGDGAAHVQA